MVFYFVHKFSDYILIFSIDSLINFNLDYKKLPKTIVAAIASVVDGKKERAPSLFPRFSALLLLLYISLSVYPKLSYMMLSASTPMLSRYSVTVLISMGGPHR